MDAFFDTATAAIPAPQNGIQGFVLCVYIRPLKVTRNSGRINQPDGRSIYNKGGSRRNPIIIQPFDHLQDYCPQIGFMSLLYCIVLYVYIGPPSHTYISREHKIL